MEQIEKHPLQPFLPSNTKLLMLGSFPPPKTRWKIEFYYPNFQNDMWRIFGLSFFGDKEFFLTPQKDNFDVVKIETFLTKTGIGISDVAQSVIRHKDNASDNFLEIVAVRDIKELLNQVKTCTTIVTTGKKATDTLIQTFNLDQPKIGSYTTFSIENRDIRLYRMPSSSRAYPKPLQDKAEIYKAMFYELGLVGRV